MKFPSVLKTHCPHCKTHTEQKVKIVKQHGRGALKAGERRFRRIMKGYRGYPRPKARVVKQTKKIDIRLECKICKKMHTKTRTFKAKKFELKR